MPGWGIINWTGPEGRWRRGLGGAGDTEAGLQSAGDHQTICIEAELWLAATDRLLKHQTVSTSLHLEDTDWPPLSLKYSINLQLEPLSVLTTWRRVPGPPGPGRPGYWPLPGLESRWTLSSWISWEQSFRWVLVRTLLLQYCMYVGMGDPCDHPEFRSRVRSADSRLSRKVESMDKMRDPITWRESEQRVACNKFREVI